MSLKKVITSGLVAATAFGSLLPLASAANARDYGRHGGHGRGHFEAPRHGGHHYNGYNRWDGHRRHNDHTGRNLAIGAFAAVLGLALAAESQRVGRDYYDDRD